MPNINEPDFNDVRDQPGFKARRAKLGRQGGAVEIVLQLDWNKVGAFERPVDGGGLALWFHESDAAGHFDA